MEELEKVELVREKCDVSYEEAREALKASDYDVLDAIVQLELHRVASSIQRTVMSRYFASVPAWSPSLARAVCMMYWPL